MLDGDRQAHVGNLDRGVRTASTMLCFRSLALLKDPKHVKSAMDDAGR